jgi:hypothetical protein
MSSLTNWCADKLASGGFEEASLNLCFDVLDYKSRVVPPGVYLRIAEPFVLR